VLAIEAISVPIEVKRSCNPEARSALPDQLFGRYMTQLGTNVGLYVVVWLSAPRLPRSARPIWPTMQSASQALEQQSADVSQATAGTSAVSLFILDASLPDLGTKRKTAKRSKAARERKPTKAAPAKAPRASRDHRRSTAKRKSAVKRSAARRPKNKGRRRKGSS
jgi:hypothetical protein